MNPWQSCSQPQHELCHTAWRLQLDFPRTWHPVSAKKKKPTQTKHNDQLHTRSMLTTSAMKLSFTKNRTSQYRNVAANIRFHQRHRTSKLVCKPTHPIVRSRSTKAYITDLITIVYTLRFKFNYENGPERFQMIQDEEKDEKSMREEKPNSPITGSTFRQTSRKGLVSISPSGDLTLFISSNAGPNTVTVDSAIVRSRDPLNRLRKFARSGIKSNLCTR
jgi:hypothetical protein